MISLGICCQGANNVPGEDRSLSSQSLRYINGIPLADINRASCCEFEKPDIVEGMLIQREKDELHVRGLNLDCKDSEVFQQNFADYLYDEFCFYKSSYGANTLIYDRPLVSSKMLSFQNQLIIQNQLKRPASRFNAIKDYIQLRAPLLNFSHVYIKAGQQGDIIIYAPSTCNSIIEYIAFKPIIAHKPTYYCGIIDFNDTTFSSCDTDDNQGLVVVNANVKIKLRETGE